VPASKVNRFRRKLESLASLSLLDGDLVDRMLLKQDLAPARTDLVPQHERSGGRLVLMEGFACRYRNLLGGRRQITAYLVPGDSYDLDTVLESDTDHAIMALTPVRAVRLSPAEVSVLMREAPAVGEALRRAARIEEATLREWLVNIGGRPALARIAHLFCELDWRLKAVGLVEDDRFEMPITQYDLADTAGLSSVHVNRTLQDLRRQGLIALAGRSLTILDRATLQALGDFQPHYLRHRVAA